jgi:methionyl-tRNA synthetase
VDAVGEHLQPEVANYLKGHFLGEPLRDWDVSRPAPYFGFEIPDSAGQLLVRLVRRADRLHGSTWQWCKRHGDDSTTGGSRPTTEIHHFIGKDITYFHTLFWPACSRRPASACRRRSTSTAF